MEFWVNKCFYFSSPFWLLFVLYYFWWRGSIIFILVCKMSFFSGPFHIFHCVFDFQLFGNGLSACMWLVKCWPSFICHLLSLNIFECSQSLYLQIFLLPQYLLLSPETSNMQMLDYWYFPNSHWGTVRVFMFNIFPLIVHMSNFY